MNIKRREFLLFFSGFAGTLALSSLQSCNLPGLKSSSKSQGFNFKPVKGPLPVPTDGIVPAQQIAEYSSYEVLDDLVLPEGFTYDAIAQWGDPVGDSRFGYNNDYLSFIETAPDQGYLAINFEYVSPEIWMQTYPLVIQKPLPLEEVKTGISKASKGESATLINAFALADNNPLKAQIQQICEEALIDQGLGVISLRRTPEGQWERTNSPADRRISGISGLKNGRYLKATGPGVKIFQKQQMQGYRDELGDRIIGTFGNCAGGTTPWGTVLSAEENFQSQVPEPVYADGTSFDPGELPFDLAANNLDGQGNVFGLAGNKYGWIVEIDPTDPNDYGTKHTWLGRYRHEAVGVRVASGKPLAFYSGCDRQGGHLYKFVSQGVVTNPTDKANSKLLTDGQLYGAKFNSDGTGTWIPLIPETAIDPQLPSQLVGNLISLPKRELPTSRQGNQRQGGYFISDRDEEIQSFKQQFKTLGDLYIGNPEEKQGAILIDAHYAANAAGVTCTARPEDTIIAPDGSLYIAFTAGGSAPEGGPDNRIFTGPKGETPYPFGWIFRLKEDGNEPASLSFTWEKLALGGEPTQGGIGFSNPDNLLVDSGSNLWIVTDMSTGGLNGAVPTRVDDSGQAIGLAKQIGIFGNNSIWFIPTTGPNLGNAYLFGLGPMECETTGPFLTQDERTLFLAVQHPGEANGIRMNGAVETRQFAMITTEGEEFIQTRQVPVGSNWPTKQPNDPPIPAVVAIRRLDSQPIPPGMTSI
ncbi:DUF839 domain-containing protein [Laspinema sp. A4]|uniref:PhoX family protein n=1 Tax=Laspinema sp. D2d TaxID=2953686 RepID=UPI0021BBAD72|nr:alkaline phosphatase PhoX [Laspinema sp. D2d]MCT7983568.1 DUF839 domain-containing protein [Laspinema sp. D2d]